MLLRIWGSSSCTLAGSDPVYSDSQGLALLETVEAKSRLLG